MSDKPKPGKDKDLRYVRQAVEATQQLFCLLSDPLTQSVNEQALCLYTEMLLIVLEQLDELDQMLFEPMVSPLPAIERNRQIRQLIRQLMQLQSSFDAAHFLLLVQNTGNQLTSLLVIKEIRIKLL